LIKKRIIVIIVADMFDFLSRSTLGVDIGTASIKIVEIAKSLPKPKLKNYGILRSRTYLERPNSAIQTNSLKILEKETADLLRILVKKAKFKSRNAVASIPSFSAFTTLLEMPIMSGVDVSKTMPFQIRQHIPLPVSEVVIDWNKVGEREDEEGLKQQILMIAVPIEIKNKYQNIFKLAGLNLKSLETESVSLVRALAAADPSPALIIDIGAYSTNIAVSENGFLKTNFFSDFAGASLTKAIANGLNIGVKRAEELKKERGLMGGGGDYELSTLSEPHLDVIIEETNRAKNNYEKSFSRKIERAIIAGGGANLPGIGNYFEKRLGMATTIGSAFSRINYPPEIGLFSKELGPEFAVAVGLGLK